MVSTDGDVAGVRVIPPIVEFVDAIENKRYSLKFTVQVVSKFSKRIRFHPPVTEKFKLISDLPSKPIAPGLEVTAIVEYSNNKSEDARDRILLAIDDDVVEVPLYAYMPTPLLDIEGPVDFGMVVANSRVVSQEVALINHGSMKGAFSIQYNGSLPIVISPTSGEVNPKTIQLIKVELATENPMKINETALVDLEGMKETKLEIKGQVVEQSLQLLKLDKKTVLERVMFGPVFYGTDHIEEAYLYNNGPEAVKWVSVLEEGVDGEEAGTDLTKSTLATLAASPMDRIRGRAYDVLTSLVTVLPNQGSIGPYQKMPIYFRFSPRFVSSNIGWEATEKPPPRQDFALFMSFERIGSNDSYMSEQGKASKKVEVAITGTAIPVLVNVQPSNIFDFGEVQCGDSTSTLCTLSNECGMLPITIKSRKIAHFNVVPMQAKIGPGKSQDVLISFQPNQPGKFQSLQIFDVIGKVCENGKDSKDDNVEAVTRLILKSFQVLPLQLMGRSIMLPKAQQPKINPGITPLISNETGPSSLVSFDEIEKVKGQVKRDIVNSAQTGLHSQGRDIHSRENASAMVAFPNDRASSIRPANIGADFQTPFTRTNRHSYVDPDYGYTAEEEEQRKNHRNKYLKYLRDQAQNRRDKETLKDFKKHDNETDIALKPASGLRPPTLTVAEIEDQDAYLVSPIKEKHRMLTTRQLANQEQQALSRPVTEGLNAVPTTAREKVDCKKLLTPQDLHKIIIGPPTVDFGEVCLRSTNSKQLHVINNLNKFIHVQVVIKCKELRQTSPLSQVVPPCSKAQFTLIFESNSEGKFQRSITYSVNSQHESHVLVLADIVPVKLEMLDTHLELSPEHGLPVEAGFRSTVTLYNRRNYPAEFTWSPILSDRGTAFSIRPATGTVNAYSDLKCEVVFHPSYFAPLEGEFHMQVHNGNAMKLNCTAKLGPVNVQFTERRVLFGNVPLNMTTVKNAILQNSGPNHAMFYVINSTPFPGMSVTPTHGIVPVGGNVDFKIALTPTAVVKFDTWIQVNIRGWKTIDVRLGGTVEPPEVDIDVKAFKYHGVYCDSSSSIPFNFVNLSSTRVQAEIDLAKYSDFKLTFPNEVMDVDLEKSENLSPDRYVISLRGGQTLPCVLTFSPTAIASYDFTLPVMVNKTGAPSPPPSTFPPTPAASEHHIVTPRQVVITIPTPRRRVVATALKPILHLSCSKMDFYLPSSIMNMHLSDNARGDEKKLVFTNSSALAVHWELGLLNVSGIGNSGFSFRKPGGAWYALDNVSGIIPSHSSYTVTISFNPTRTGSYSFKIPLYLQGNKSLPYRHIQLNCLIEVPNITFDPLALVLTPVPLSTAVYAEFNMVATGYLKETPLTYSIPEVEADDGSKVSCFDLEFPNGACIPTPKDISKLDGARVNVPCILTFNSTKPVSATVDITISDDAGKSYTIPVTATADNCLLTVYPFIAAHRNDHQIVCEQEKLLRVPQQEANSASMGEAVLLPCASPTRPSTRASTSATSSQFETSSTSYDDSTNTVSDRMTLGSSYLSASSRFVSIPNSAFSSGPSIMFKSADLVYRQPDSDFLPMSRDGAAQPVLPENSDTTATSKRPILARQQMTNKNATSIQKVVAIDDKETEVALSRRELISRSLGSAVFPFESTLEAHFHHEVLSAVQRWFSSHGWPGGPFPVTVPQTLRRLFSRNSSDDLDTSLKRKVSKMSNASKTSIKMAGGWGGLKKDVKTVYDMLFHLCGRAVPGISQNQPLPGDRTERVTQLHWQHSTLLSFLRGQGASVAAIRPEFLFTPTDYRHWVKIRQLEAKCQREQDEDEGKDLLNDQAAKGNKADEMAALDIEDDLFESVSKRAWTDLLLQLYKVLVLARINPAPPETTKQGKGGDRKISESEKGTEPPKINPNPYASNVYGVGERMVLAWLNHHYGEQRHLVWGGPKAKGGRPPARWVVNFDYDLLDGLVLATAMAAYCPWLINDYFIEMYTAPATPEQCLHNTLILVKAMRSVGIDYDIQATDITDPNPIALLMLCVYLYQNLPQYVVKSKVTFVGSLHKEVLKQIRLSNSSSRALKYIVKISGRDAGDFRLPKGEEISVHSSANPSLRRNRGAGNFANGGPCIHFMHPCIMTVHSLAISDQSVKGGLGTVHPLQRGCTVRNPPLTDWSEIARKCLDETRRGGTNLDVVFKSRLIRPAEAILLLVGIRSPATDSSHQQQQQPSTVGTTMVFTLHGSVNSITPSGSLRVETPCYEMVPVNLQITNPFPTSANFRIHLVESNDSPPSPLNIGRKRGAGAETSMSKSATSRTKSVRSKINHGKAKEPSPPPSPPPADRLVPDNKQSKPATMTSQLTAFYCNQSSIFIQGKQTADFELEFLPFNTGKKYCSALFVNENVGEFLYSIEGNAILPQPTSIPYNADSPHAVRVSSAAAKVKQKGSTKNEDLVVHWKCENNSILKESLMIPVTNSLKEKALRTAARQRMSTREKQRRSLTGTLDSGSVTAFVALMGMLDIQNEAERDNQSTYPASLPPPLPDSRFTVEVSCKWFKVPEKIDIPLPTTHGPKLASEMSLDDSGPNDRQDDGYIALPIEFEPSGPGYYPCDIILRSPGDVRLYKVDCTVSPAGTVARLDFTTPAHQSVTQNIPIQNASNHDWEMECIIEGDGFYGPGHMLARAGQTAFYPLMFKPHYECTVTGKLLIKNKTGTEHVFTLCGVGESPMALDHIVIPCKCREATSYTVSVPNYAPHKLAYKVLTDIACLDGPNIVSALKSENAEYTFTVSPWQRGTSSGILAFVVDDMEKAKNFYKDDSDSDSDSAPVTKLPAKKGRGKASHEKDTPAYLKPQKSLDAGLSSYRVWYSVELRAQPGDPIGELDVDCPVQSAREVEIPIRNPSGESVQFEVSIDNEMLQGDSSITLAPHIPAVYKASFTPCVIGASEASIVFYSKYTGEFWYKINLNAVSPEPTQLPGMECQLGRWSRQYITISNPTDEPMDTECHISNPDNFTLDVPAFSTSEDEAPSLRFEVQPKSNFNIPLQFMPTSLGAANHQATITLKSKQMGEAKYLVAGRGVSPQPMEPVSVSAGVGSNTSLILPFRNPTDVPVLVDVTLTDHDHTLNSISDSVIRNHITTDSAFCLLLKHTRNIRLEPKETLDIPFTFSPDKMRKYSGSLTIGIRREDGESWPDETDGYEEFVGWRKASVGTQSPESVSRDDEGFVKTIRWVFPVHGIPEVRSDRSKEAILSCQARSRIEERLEVTLTGAVPSVASAQEFAKLRAVSPLDKRPRSVRSQSDGVIVEGRTVTNEFSYYLEYPEDADARQHLEQSLAVSLVRKDRDLQTGMVVLLFNLVFSPFRQLRETVILTVTSATGGVWRFPISVRASEPPPDDVISIEAAGLGKGSTVSFTMFSHTKHPTPFNAYFVGGSEHEFSVEPESGELLPQGSSGTRISITFTPQIYGKAYKTRLVVQTVDMQWAYDIKGTAPEYKVPQVGSAIFPSGRPRGTPLQPKKQRPNVNFLRENMKLTTTAVSSPMKGYKLVKSHIKSN